MSGNGLSSFFYSNLIYLTASMQIWRVLHMVLWPAAQRPRHTSRWHEGRCHKPARVVMVPPDWLRQLAIHLGCLWDTASRRFWGKVFQRQTQADQQVKAAGLALRFCVQAIGLPTVMAPCVTDMWQCSLRLHGKTDSQRSGRKRYAPDDLAQWTTQRKPL